MVCIRRRDALFSSKDEGRRFYGTAYVQVGHSYKFLEYEIALSCNVMALHHQQLKECFHVSGYELGPPILVDQEYLGRRYMQCATLLKEDARMIYFPLDIKIH